MATITKRQNKNGISYLIGVSLGTNIEGKQIREYKTYKPNKNMAEKQIKKELNKVALDFEEKLKTGYILNNKQNFSKYARYVIDLKERNGVKHKTIIRYNDLIKRIDPIIGHIKLIELRPQHLNNLYEKIGKNGVNKITGGKLSNKTILEHHRLISTILRQAEKEMLVTYNAASKASPPRMSKINPNYFELEDIEKIRNCLDLEPLKWKTATYILLLTGMRRGELMGLKWDKILWDTSQIKIDTNLLYSSEKGIYEDTTKSTTSNRTIKLPLETMDLLKEYRNWYIDLSLNSDKWENSNFLFVQKNGLPMHPDSLTDWFNKFSKRHNLTHINPHAFRHTMASVLYFNNIDSISISKRLGHSKVSTTTDLYSHVLQESDDRASECIADVILRKNTSNKLAT